MNQNKTGNEEDPTAAKALAVGHEPSEEALATQEFASLVKRGGITCRAMGRGESYEVHPCKRVRGYVLRLPVIGWTIWHPTAAAAMDYAARLAGIYPAECRVYDAEGGLRSRRTITPLPVVASN